MFDFLRRQAGLILDSFEDLTWSDLPNIGTLVLLEGVLSVENAVILALLADRLPDRRQQQLALRVGIWCSYLMRFFVIFFAGWLLEYSFVKWIAAGYLLWLGVGGLVAAEHGEAGPGESGVDRLLTRLGVSLFVRTVLVIELTDVFFSIDSITAALAFSPKLAVVFIGGCLGVLALRYAAQFFMGLIERYPILKKTSFLLVLMIGLKLLAHSGPFPGIAGITWMTFNVHVPELLGVGMVIGTFLGSIGIAHFFPNSRIGRIGRKPAPATPPEA